MIPARPERHLPPLNGNVEVKRFVSRYTTPRSTRVRGIKWRLVASGVFVANFSGFHNTNEILALGIGVCDKIDVTLCGIIVLFDLDKGISLFGLEHHALSFPDFHRFANGFLGAVGVLVVVRCENESSKRTETQDRKDEGV